MPVRETLTHNEIISLAAKDKRATSWVRNRYFKHHIGYSLNNALIQQGTTPGARARQLWKSHYKAIELAIARLKDASDATLLKRRNEHKFGDPIGPSFERLKDAALRQDLNGTDQLKAVLDWALRPDLYKCEWSESLGHSRLHRLTPKAKAGTSRLARRASWAVTDNPERPLTAKLGRKTWTVRINDFPDEPLYTLLEDGMAVMDFDDWPKSWQRPVV